MKARPSRNQKLQCARSYGRPELGLSRDMGQVSGMEKVLEIFEVVAELTRAFRPLVCSADVYNYRTHVRYRVFDRESGAPIVAVYGLRLRDLCSADALRAEINATRARLELHGFAIGPQDNPLAVLVGCRFRTVCRRLRFTEAIGGCCRTSRVKKPWR